MENGLEHFVVVKEVFKDTIYLMDPGIGNTKMTITNFNKLFTGNIIEVYPRDTIIKMDQELSISDLFFKVLKKEKFLFIKIIITSILWTVLLVLSSYYLKIGSNLINEDNNLIKYLIIVFALITCLKVFVLFIREYYEKDIPETQKLVWHVQKFPFVKDQDVGKNLDFRNITNPHTLKNVQTFCKYQLEVCSITFGSTYRYLHSIKIFSEWLDNFYASSDLDKLNRDVLEEYMLYLRTCGKYSSHESNLNIQNLKVFFEWGAFHEMKHMPKDVLLISSDFAIKSKKESRYLTDDELRGVISVIPMMPKLYGKMLYCLIFLGVRYSELAKLSIDCIKQNEDGTYYLDLWQYKTDVFYEKPVYQNCIKIIKNEIELNKKRFGEDLTYVFVSNKNKPIGIKSMNDNIQKALIKGNVKGRDGKILHCTTHQFRATLATNLISEGVAVKVASELLGQTNPRSINHYVAITQDKVKEYLKPRLEKDERLIRNIGKMEELKEIPTEETVALCNGFCSKNPLTTPCAKANACFSCPLFIPSKQFLNMYEMQLLEIEATIKIAETNGYDLMLEKAIEDQNAILNILKRLEQIGGKSNDNERKENDRNKET